MVYREFLANPQGKNITYEIRGVKLGGLKIVCFMPPEKNWTTLKCMFKGHLLPRSHTVSKQGDVTPKRCPK